MIKRNHTNHAPKTVNRPRCRFIIKEQELSYCFRPLVWHLTSLITLKQPATPTVTRLLICSSIKRNQARNLMIDLRCKTVSCQTIKNICSKSFFFVLLQGNNTNDKSTDIKKRFNYEQDSCSCSRHGKHRSLRN